MLSCGPKRDPYRSMKKVKVSHSWTIKHAVKILKLSHFACGSTA